MKELWNTIPLRKLLDVVGIRCEVNVAVIFGVQN